MSDDNTTVTPAPAVEDTDTKVSKAIQYLIDRSTEASSVRGFVGALTLVAGLVVKPDRLDAVAMTAAGVSAFLKVALPDDLTPIVKSVRSFFSNIFSKKA